MSRWPTTSPAISPSRCARSERERYRQRASARPISLETTSQAFPFPRLRLDAVFGLPVMRIIELFEAHAGCERVVALEGAVQQHMHDAVGRPFAGRADAV